MVGRSSFPIFNIVLRSFLAFCAAFLVGCSLFGPSAPSEVIGKWLIDLQANDIQVFTFSQHSVTYDFVDFSDATNNVHWTENITKVYPDEAMLKAGADKSPLYFAWHIVSPSEAVITWTNGDPKPVYAANWWAGWSVYTKQ